jgi:hypothetical protein
MTENLHNLKFYVGKHSCNKLDCDYLGSGKHLTYAICKYGRVNFRRDNLAVFETEEEAYEEERRIVTPEFVSRVDTYNLKCGGHGNQAGEGNLRSELYTPPIAMLIDRMITAGRGWTYITDILNEIGITASNGEPIRPSTVHTAYGKMVDRGILEKISYHDPILI